MKTKHWLLLLLGNLLVLLFLPRFIIYNLTLIEGIFVVCLYLVVHPFLAYKSLDILKTKEQSRIVCTAASVFVLIPIMILTHENRFENDIITNGIQTWARVEEKKYFETKPHGWRIQCAYNANGSEFKTEFYPDYEDKYAVGDLIRIVYLSDYPSHL
jgi:hypothetical protein